MDETTEAGFCEEHSKEQKLKRFLELTGNIYLDLVKVFYTNLQFSNDSLISHVKGVDMVITSEV